MSISTTASFANKVEEEEGSGERYHKYILEAVASYQLSSPPVGTIASVDKRQDRPTLNNQVLLFLKAANHLRADIFFSNHHKYTEKKMFKKIKKKMGKPAAATAPPSSGKFIKIDLQVYYFLPSIICLCLTI